MNPEPPPPPDAGSLLPKFLRYKSTKRNTSDDAQPRQTVAQNDTTLSTGVGRSTSRYHRGRAPEQADRFRSVPALPKHAPRPFLQRSMTSENVATPNSDTESGEVSPTTLNKAQQEAFDILTGKVDTQQQSLQRQIDEKRRKDAQLEERKRREGLAEKFKRESQSDQAKRIADQQALLKARQDSLRKARAERDAQKQARDAKHDRRQIESDRHAANQAGNSGEKSKSSGEEIQGHTRAPRQLQMDRGLAEPDQHSGVYDTEMERKTSKSNEELGQYFRRLSNQPQYLQNGNGVTRSTTLARRNSSGKLEQDNGMSNEVQKQVRLLSDEAAQWTSATAPSSDHLRRAPAVIPGSLLEGSAQSSFSNSPKQKSQTQPTPTSYKAAQFPSSTGIDTSRKLVKRQAPNYSQSEDPFGPEAAIPQMSKEAPPPNFDAPKSAVNAGVRTVKVFYAEKSMQLPVTPSSTSIDILSSAKDLLEYGFDPNRYVLEEHFKPLELTRPLRQYERIRDVMNSWNRDEQNYFMIVSAATQWDSASLKQANAPREQPEGMSVTVYHSQHPRVWDKRLVTLRADGQVIVQKHSDAAATNMCHMSDFDVFMPTKKEVKELKAPRKYCFAIKSLQKPAAFLNKANFVHFICTKDQGLAMEWYKAIHGWRTYYMVHTLGLGKEQSKSASEELKEPLVTTIRSRNASGDTRMLPDASYVTSPSAQSPSHPLSSRTFNTRGGPPSSFARSMSRDDDPGIVRTRARSTSRTRSRTSSDKPLITPDPEPFAATGLLGRTYTMRRQALDDHDNNGLGNTPDPPTLPGVKPLVTLTGETKLPPQFSRRGHGVQLDAVPTGGLVTAATSSTSPEHTVNPLLPQDAQGGGLNRSSSRRTRTLRQGSEPPPDAFTGGLLASAPQTPKKIGTGRGVAVGDRNATEPMLDLAEESKYVPGSLLREVEQQQGDKEVVIARGRGREEVVRTGEGF